MQPIGFHPGGWQRFPMLTRWQRFRQRLRDVWQIATGRLSLHIAWQRGYDQGQETEYQRTVVMGGR